MSILIGALIALLLFARAFLVTWLVERPDGPAATTEEIEKELRKTFGPKDELEFIILPEHIDPILDISGEQFSGGFRQRQLEMLRFRIDRQRPGVSRSATYPVTYKEEESELILEWILNHDRIHIRISAPEGSLEPVREAVLHSPAQIFSESLTCAVS